MGSFRQVTGDRAGPAALGILAPPGQRTVLILRPRTLDWDLVLLLRPGSDAFRELTRDQTAAGAQAVLHALEHWAAGGPGAVEAVPRDNGTYHVRLTVANFPFLVCPRLPGRPYQPLVCSDLDSASHVGGIVNDALFPPPGVEREIYLNNVFFSR